MFFFSTSVVRWGSLAGGWRSTVSLIELHWETKSSKTSSQHWTLRPPGGEPRLDIAVFNLPVLLTRMVIACHYDSKIDPPGFLAATDSAVPCAMMINLAQTLREELRVQRSTNHDLTLQFLFLDGEEAFVRWTSTDSIYGARRLAADLERERFSSGGVAGNELDRMDIFVLLDLLGAKGMTLSKLETSTGDWYDNLVRIERSLQQRNYIRGPNIFNVSS